MSSLKIVLLILLGVFLSGCGMYYSPEPPIIGRYYLNPARSISQVGKVVVIELDNYSAHPQISADFTEALSEAMAKRNLFGQDIIYRGSAVYNSLQLDESSTNNMQRLAAVRASAKADAVLVGAIIQYQAYPHMTVGIRVKLIDLQDGQLLWAVQQVWDSRDKAVQESMRYFFRTQRGAGYEPLGWRLGIVSPRHFREFVAFEIARTLP